MAQNTQEYFNYVLQYKEIYVEKNIYYVQNFIEN